MKVTLLLTCVGGELAPQLIRSLKDGSRHRVRVVGVDARADAAGRHFADAFAVVPAGTDPGYPEAIAELAARHSVDIVLPTSDEEALALAGARVRVEAAGCRIACTKHEVLEVISDKAAAYRRLAELGLHVPAWRLARTPEELDEAVTFFVEGHGGAVVKPTAQRGGRGVAVIRPGARTSAPQPGARETHMELERFRTGGADLWAGSFPVLIMEPLVEPVFDLDMLAWDGRAIRVVPRRRVHSALPNEGHVFVANPDLVALGEQLIAGLGLSWLYDCDVMYDRAGRAGVLEVNPRPSGSVAVTLAAGVPLLDDMISLAMGEEVPPVDLPAGRRVVPFKSLAVVAE